jgi:hypothetical protein
MPLISTTENKIQQLTVEVFATKSHTLCARGKILRRALRNEYRTGSLSKSWHGLLLLYYSFRSYAVSCDGNNSTTTSTEIVNFEGCIAALASADRNQDGAVKQNEFLDFINGYYERNCATGAQQTALTLQQEATFNTLACICRSIASEALDCYLAENARIPTAGAQLMAKDRTSSEVS